MQKYNVTHKFLKQCLSIEAVKGLYVEVYQTINLAGLRVSHTIRGVHVNATSVGSCGYEKLTWYEYSKSCENKLVV